MKPIKVEVGLFFLSILVSASACTHQPLINEIHSDDPLSYISGITGSYNMVGYQFDGLDTTDITFKDNLESIDLNGVLRNNPAQKYIFYIASKTDKTVTFVYTYNAPLNVAARDTIVFYYLADSITHSGYETYSSGSRIFKAHSVSKVL